MHPNLVLTRSISNIVNKSRTKARENFTVPVGRDRKFQTALKTNQIVEFVSMPSTVPVGRDRKFKTALRTNQNVTFVTMPSNEKIKRLYQVFEGEQQVDSVEECRKIITLINPDACT